MAIKVGKVVVQRLFGGIILPLDLGSRVNGLGLRSRQGLYRGCSIQRRTRKGNESTSINASTAPNDFKHREPNNQKI